MGDASGQPRQITILAIFSALWLAIYIWLAHFTERSDTAQVVFLFASGFVLYGIFLRYFSKKVSWKHLILVGVVLRLAVVPGDPNLSDDYYRFMWDGQLVENGISPYEFTPRQLLETEHMKNSTVDGKLVEVMNSPDYFSVYPPIKQTLFTVCSVLSAGNPLAYAIVLKILILLFEIGTMFLIVRLLAMAKMPEHRISLYALNPLVIVELTGNGHFEGIMLCMLLAAIILLIEGRLVLAASAFIISVGIKLLPLMFLPALVKRIGLMKTIYFSSAVVGVTLLSFVPLISLETVINFGASLDLYFQTFEFNASIYYLVRWIGMQVMGYNIIGSAGPILGLIAGLIILTIAWSRKEVSWQRLFQIMLVSMAIFFLMSTTVHPWYITSLVVLSVFVRMDFAILWSALAWLSYTAYATPEVKEATWILFLEYGLVYAVLGYELWVWAKSKNELATQES